MSLTSLFFPGKRRRKISDSTSDSPSSSLSSQDLEKTTKRKTMDALPTTGRVSSVSDNDSILEKLLSGQEKMMVRLTSLDEKLQGLTEENVELKRRLGEAEVDSSATKVWVTKQFDAMSKQLMSMRQYVNGELEGAKIEIDKTGKAFDAMEKKVAAISESARGHARSPVPRSSATTRDRSLQNCPPSTTTATIRTQLHEEREMQARENNFVLFNLPEMDATESETTNTITTSPCSSDSDRLREEVTKIFPHLDESAEIIRLGKVPSPQNARPRPVLIKTTRPNKAQAFLAKHQLRTRSLFVNHDLTREQQHRRREVVSTYKELRRRAIKCTLPYDQILFEGRAMTDEDVAKHLADTDEPDSQ